METQAKTRETYRVEYYENEADWREARRGYIGASDAAAIFGVGYKNQSALTVWYDKVHGTDDKELSEALQERFFIGSAVEPAIRKIFRRKTGMETVHEPRWFTCVSNEFPWMAATPDAECYGTDGERGLLECKNLSFHNWGTGEVPLKYNIQVQHQMAVTGMQFAYVGGLIDGQRAEFKRIDRDDEFIKMMIERLMDFWAHVVHKEMPEPTGSYADTRLLTRLHPDDDGEVVSVSDEGVTVVVEQLHNEKAVLQEAQQRIRKWENYLRVMLGDHTYLALPDGSAVSWKTQERSGYTVEPSKTRVLRYLKKLPKGAIDE
jgi:putative phage-type endonuclease